MKCFMNSNKLDGKYVLKLISFDRMQHFENGEK